MDEYEAERLYYASQERHYPEDDLPDDDPGYVVVMFDASGWHAVGVYPDWPAALIAHGAAINALRVVDHPHAEDVKIIPDCEDYAHPPLAEPVEA